jgi:hypothetical protein
MAQRNVGLMGQYAGFVTRAVAILIDILIVVVSVMVITASISLPLDFFPRRQHADLPGHIERPFAAARLGRDARDCCAPPST